MDTSTPLASTLIDRPQSFEEMASRAGFLTPLDHAEHTLESVLSAYSFQRQVPCGLKGCRQLHYSGLLVRTASGAETNLGHVCGRSHFGDDFQTAVAVHQQLRDRADLIARAKGLQAEAPAIALKIKEFGYSRAFGAKWATKVGAEIAWVIGQPLLDSLAVAQMRGDLEVKEYRQRTEEEIDDLVAANPGMTRARARDATSVIGVLEPMPWAGFDFRGTLMTGLLQPLLAFAECDVEQMTTAKLRTALKPLEDHKQVLQKAEEAATSVIRFLTEDNLKLVALWIPERQRDKADLLRGWIGKGKHTRLLDGTA